MAALTPKTQLRIPEGVPYRKRRVATLEGVQNQVREVVTSMSPSSVGIELALSVLLGFAIGWWIDGRLGTFPLFLLVFLGLGTAAGFRGVIRAARKAMPDPEDR
jgi:F0F1-type ATP synthase assembly protein I